MALSTDSEGYRPNTDIAPLMDKSLSIVEEAIALLGTQLPTDAKWYRYKNDILLTRATSDIDSLLKELYIIRFGMRIGRIEGNNFEPLPPLGVHFEHTKLLKYEISKEELKDFLR